MPIRITGMNSGLDTESIITALTQRYQDKVDNNKSNQKKLNWKQDKWKELNKKVSNFYNGTLANMRFSTAYSKKVTTASNSNAVSIVTGDNAMNANQKLNIKQLASSAFMTGNEVTLADGTTAATKSSTMADLGLGSGQLQFKIGGSDTDVISVDIAAEDNIEAVLTKLRAAKSSETGTSLDFNYDENNNRFFVSSKEAGDGNNFEAVSSDFSAKLGFNSTNYEAGHDAHIELNGVSYYSKSNTFSINGLTITANEVAENITLSTKQDTSGIYDNIKKMLKEYNELMKEVATAYNADKATKYKMLTDDQKDEMTDKEVEEWEKKIKDGLLSKDETLGNIRTGLRTAAGSGFDITLKDGTVRKMTLADFGIATGSFFSTDENERDAFHIDGDPDDAVSAGNTDVLKAMISSDPEAVQSYFTQFAREVYGKLSDLMKGTEYSSSFTIYEDKLMASQYSAYNTKISDAEKALERAQDRYYSKFTAMEKALAKINSTSGSFGSMFGNG